MEMRLLFQELWDRFDFQWCETPAGGEWLPRAFNHVGKDKEAWDALLVRLDKSVEWVRALANGIDGQKKQEEPLPPEPTPEFCLLPGKWVRWKGKVELKDSEYRLFKRLLEHRWDSIEVARVKEDVWVGKRGRDDGDISDKTVQNTLYGLINSLAAIRFPIEWVWRYPHIVRESIR